MVQARKIHQFPGYNIIREDREDGKAGVAIFLKSNIFYRENTSYHKVSHLLSCAVILTYNEKPLNIVSFYNPSSTITSRDWRLFFESFPGPSIIGGDSNCHHQVWGCSLTDSKGRSLLDAIDDANLILLNTGEPTLLKSIHHRNNSAVDISLITSDLSGIISEWKVEDDTLGSNHFPIKMISHVISIHSIIKQPIRKWKIKQANWGIFQNEIESLTKRANKKSEINQISYAQFMEILNQASEKSIPKVNSFNENQKFRRPWWNEKCGKLMQERKLKLNEYKCVHLPKTL